ncbi:MAG: maltokinase N-terminal cap-like domain-containing protein, partial [Terracidiphilus sp.]
MTLQQLDAQFLARLRTGFAAQLSEYLPKQRWFGSKAKRIHSVQLADCIPVPLTHSLALIALASVDFAQGPSETYVVPLMGPSADRSQPADSVVVRLPVSQPASELPLFDALDNSEFLAAIFRAIANSQSFTGEIGSLRGNPEPPLNGKKAESTVSLTPRQLKAEQSNTSIVYGDRYILKFFRRLEQGLNPDVEIGRFLTTVAHFPNVPPHCGALTYVSPEPKGLQESKVITLGILQGFVPNRGDAWRFTVESIA